MKNALLLLLSANRMLVQIMVSGRVTAEQEFTDTPEGKVDFTAFLKTSKYPAYLLVDLIEEDFRQESIPHLMGRSHHALLQRKFEQFYRNTPFRQATLLERQKTGRRDDDMLFSALTNPGLITPWLNILLEQAIPLAGIYSVPQISSPLVKDHPSDYLLLISWEKSAGLRQTYFSQHRLQISRLTPVNADMNFQDAVMVELPRIYQYLKSLSLLPADQTLNVRLLGIKSDLIELQPILPDNADMRCELVELSKLSRQLGIEQQFTDSDASQIFLHNLATNPPPTHYANATHIRYCTLWRLRRALNWIGGSLLLGSLLGGAVDIWQGGQNAHEVRAMNTETQRLLNETGKVTDAFPQTLVPASDMKASVSILRDLERRTLLPTEVMQPISNMLDQYPQIELGELNWSLNTTESMPADHRSSILPQALTLKGRLLNFANDYRSAIDYLQRFSQMLEKQGYHVTVLNEPLDVSPSGSIADRRDTQDEKLDFSLKLFRSPPP